MDVPRFRFIELVTKEIMSGIVVRFEPAKIATDGLSPGIIERALQGQQLVLGNRLWGCRGLLQAEGFAGCFEIVVQVILQELRTGVPTVSVVHAEEKDGIQGMIGVINDRRFGWRVRPAVAKGGKVNNSGLPGIFVIAAFTSRGVNTEVMLG